MNFGKHLNYMLQKTGQLCAVSGSTARFYGILNAETRIEADQTGYDVLVRETSITTTTATADMLTKGTKLLVGSDTYSVRETRLIDDGELTQVMVAKV